MYVICLFVLNLIVTFLVYFWARSPKNSEVFSKFPFHLIVKNRFALSLFIFPVNKPIPIWNLILLIFQYITFLIVFIVSIIYFINSSAIECLNSVYSLVIYSIWFLIYFIPIGIVNTTFTQKYLK